MKATKKLRVQCAQPTWGDKSDPNPPGLIAQRVPKRPVCEEYVFALSNAIIRDDRPYCSQECADYGTVWNIQMKKFEATQTAIWSLENVWQQDDDTLSCERCTYSGHSSLHWSTLLFGEKPRDMCGLCSLCALILATTKEKQNRWAIADHPIIDERQQQLLPKPSLLQYTSRWSLPDGWQQHVFGDNFEEEAKKCTFKGANCYGIRWIPQFGYNFAAVKKTVANPEAENNSRELWCIACMEDDDWQERNTWWNKVRQVVIQTLSVDGPLIPPLVVVIADFLIKPYGDGQIML